MLVDLLTRFGDGALVEIDRDSIRLGPSRTPRRISDVMRRRLEQLSMPARRAATAAASLGRRFSLDHLATMLDDTPIALLVPVDELIAAGVLTDVDGTLAFSHDLVRDAVRDIVPEAVRRSLDRQAAAGLLAGGALPVDVAIQLSASAERGDEVAITTLLKAAEVLAPTDPSAAADLGQRALALAPDHHPLRGPLVAQTAVCLHAAGRAEEAKTFADTALRHVLPPQQEATVRLSIGGMFSISPDDRADSCRQALALPGLSDGLRARHLALLFHNLVTAGRVDHARDVLDDACDATQVAGDLAARFVLELAQSGLAYIDGEFTRAQQFVEQALRTSLAADDPPRAHLTRTDALRDPARP